jgi:membrane protein implicated in regulation of membrane protease activity
MARNMTPHLRFVLIWSIVALIAAATLLVAHLPVFIVLVALVWAAVLIGAWQWRPTVNRVPSVSFSTWLRTPSTPTRSSPK